jgi:hypothetical protein
VRLFICLFSADQHRIYRMIDLGCQLSGFSDQFKCHRMNTALFLLHKYHDAFPCIFVHGLFHFILNQ